MASRGFNKAIVQGTVGRDPEVRYLQNGNAVASFSIATSESWRDKASGEKKENTEWHNIACFGKLAETVGEYVKKGSHLLVEGKLKTSSWEKDGVKRYKTEIMLDNFQFVGPKVGGQQASSSPAAAPQPAPSAVDDFDDDIPF